MATMPDTPATHKDIQLVLQQIEALSHSFLEWKETRKADHDALTRMDVNMTGVCQDMLESRERIDKLEANKAERSEVAALSEQVRRLSDSIDKLGARLEAAIVGAQSAAQSGSVKGFVASGASGGGVLGLIIAILYLIAKYQGWL